MRPGPPEMVVLRYLRDLGDEAHANAIVILAGLQERCVKRLVLRTQLQCVLPLSALFF